jgi:DNA invertase Pin-like site-specific DNA recombinase
MGTAALYVRVSSEEQTTQNQEPELRRWAKRLGLKVVKKYADNGLSGSRRNRPGLIAMLNGAHRRDFDVLLIWALDRLTREGVGETLAYLKKLKAAGVAVRSLHEDWLNTSDPIVGELLVSIFAWVAKQERARHSERTKAGLRRALNKGKKLGRPTIDADKQDAIRDYLRQGKHSYREIAELVDVGSATVQRLSADLTVKPRRQKGRPIS